MRAPRELARAGVDVLVIEARERVGGRTLNHVLPNGRVIEVGGQWVGPLPGQPANGGFPPTPQARILQLAQDVGVGTFGTETATQWMGYMDGAVQSGQRAAAEALAAL